METIPSLEVLKEFYLLKSLSLCRCCLSEVGVLNSLSNLKELWLNENTIESVDLGSLSKLEKLDLSNNSISEFASLKLPSGLKTLWVNNNYLANLKGVKALKSICELWAAGNQLSGVSKQVLELENLSNLNLSGNFIESLENLYLLSFVEPLKELYLGSCEFGTNPICELSNYRTFVVYYVPQVSYLDGVFISEDLKAQEEQNFSKKTIFYNYTVATTKRTIDYLEQVTKKVFEEKISSFWDVFQKVMFRKALSREDHYSQVISRGLEDQDSLQRLYSHTVSKLRHSSEEFSTMKVKELSSAGNVVFEIGDSAKDWYRDCCEYVYSKYPAWAPQIRIIRVIKVHNKTLQKKFHDKAESILTPRTKAFKNKQEYLFYGKMPGEDITQVASEGFSGREFLGLTNCVATADYDRIRSLETELPSLYWPSAQVLMCKGFLGKSSWDMQVPYYEKNMSVCDVWEMYPLKKPKSSFSVYRTSESNKANQVWFFFDNQLVLPEYLIDFEYCHENHPMCSQKLKEQVPEEVFGSPEVNYLGFTISEFVEEDLLSQETPSDFLATQPETSRELSSSERNIETLISEASQELDLSWSKLTSVVPLFGLHKLKHCNLSFNRISKLKGLSVCAELQTLYLHHNFISCLRQISYLPSKLKSVSLFCNPVYSSYSYKYAMLFHLKHLQTLDYHAVTPEETPLTTSEFLFKKPSHTATRMYFNYKSRIEFLNLSNQQLKSVNLQESATLKSLDLSKNLIKSFKGLQNLPNLEELDLSCNALISIQGIHSLGSLKQLDLSHNSISEIGELQNLNYLQRLNLSFNQVSSLKGLESLLSLNEAYLSCNLIGDLKETLSLKANKTLFILDLFRNPVSNQNYYRTYLIYNLPSLKFLDGKTVTFQETETAKETYAGKLTEEVLLGRIQETNSVTTRKIDLSFAKINNLNNLLSHSKFPLLQEMNLSHNIFESLDPIPYLPCLVKLTISNNSISTLHASETPCFSKFPSLEMLDVSFNNIREFKELQVNHFTRLSTLVVSHNKLTKVEHLDQFGGLREVDLSYNKLLKFEVELRLDYLIFLNAENNNIRSLDNLCGLGSLKVLFLANNRIIDAREIDKLRKLESLVELELNGNLFLRRNTNRLLIISRLPNLLFLNREKVSKEEKDKLDANKTQVFRNVGFSLPRNLELNFQKAFTFGPKNIFNLNPKKLSRHHKRN